MPTSGSISGANSRIPAGNLGKLKRELGLYDAAAIDIGAIIGAGIFVVIGVAASVAGAGLIFSLILAGAVSYITALSYAELSHRIPIEGGEYNFAYRLISHDAGFLDGVLWCLSTAVSGAVVSIGLSNYFVVLFPGLDQKLIAIAAIFLMALLNIVGIKRSSIVNEALVVMKIGILLFFSRFLRRMFGESFPVRIDDTPDEKADALDVRVVRGDRGCDHCRAQSVNWFYGSARY